jgi:hypothetical protein
MPAWPMWMERHLWLINSSYRCSTWNATTNLPFNSQNSDKKAKYLKPSPLSIYTLKMQIENSKTWGSSGLGARARNKVREAGGQISFCIASTRKVPGRIWWLKKRKGSGRRLCCPLAARSCHANCRKSRYGHSKMSSFSYKADVDIRILGMWMLTMNATALSLQRIGRLRLWGV